MTAAPQMSPLRLVVCGTDTDVGKTVVSALLVQGLGARYWKPVQSGCEDGGDSGRLQRLLNLPDGRILPEAYRLAEPVSPHWAAERQGVSIEPERLTLPAGPGALVVETAGGCWCLCDAIGCRLTSCSAGDCRWCWWAAAAWAP